MQAATQGRWLVLEGVDLAPPDLLASLVPLLESRQLPAQLHGAGGTCHPNFHLIATATTVPGKRCCGLPALLAVHTVCKGRLQGSRVTALRIHFPACHQLASHAQLRIHAGWCGWHRPRGKQNSML